MIRESERREQFASDCVIQQGVLDIRDSPGTCAKPAHLAGIFASRSPERCSPQGSDRIFADSSLLAEPTVDVDAFNEYGSEALIIGLRESGRAADSQCRTKRKPELRPQTWASLQTCCAHPSACFCAAQESGRVTRLVSND